MEQSIEGISGKMAVPFNPLIKPLSVLFLQSSNAGVAFYRLYSWAITAHRTKTFSAFIPWWDKSLTETHPWEVDIDDPQHKYRILNELNDHVKKADIIVAQMVHTRAALIVLEGIREMYGIPVVAEIDDNMLSTPSYNPADMVYQPGSSFRALAIEQFKMSDAMIVSTPYLQEVYGDLNSDIQVVPNSLDMRVWDNLKHRRNTDFIRIGWAGGYSHEEDLRIIEPVVRKILEKHQTVRFCFVHGIPPFLKNIDRVETVSQFIRIDRYPQFLASKSFDIGVAPLVDNSFNRAKSNLRWLEYAGLKVPCVASSVGHFKETVNHGEDGLLCDSENDWLDSLDWLIHDENARRKIGKNANARARRDFNLDLNVAKYRDILQNIVNRHAEKKADVAQEATA